MSNLRETWAALKRIEWAYHSDPARSKPRLIKSAYREPPAPKPLQTWQDRVKMRHVVLPPSAGAVSYLLVRFVWRWWTGTFSFANPDAHNALDVIGFLLLVVAGLTCCAIVFRLIIINWNRPINKWLNR